MIMAPPTTFDSNEFKTKKVKFHQLTHFIHMKIGYYDQTISIDSIILGLLNELT